MDKIIEINNICKIYGEDEPVYALDHVSLQIERGESVAIMGTSGSGKSTLLNILGILDVATEGDYHLFGKNIAEYSMKEKAKLRNEKFGFVVQDFALISHYSALKNVMLPLEYTELSKKEKIERAMKLMERLGIVHRAKAVPAKLSGGQKQRVAIARALVNHADILLCDEPTGALDSKTTEDIMALLMELNREGKTLVIVTHDEKVAKYCKKQYVMNDGKFVQV